MATTTGRSGLRRAPAEASWTRPAGRLLKWTDARDVHGSMREVNDAWRVVAYARFGRLRKARARRRRLRRTGIPPALLRMADAAVA